jgi:hypothetical protein
MFWKVIQQKWKWILFIIIICYGSSLFFWWWFGKSFKYGTHLQVDFFNTVCGIATVIALLIGLYQIAELKAEQQIREDAIKKFKIEYFKNDATFELGLLRADIINLQISINRETNITQLVIITYIDILNRTTNTFRKLESQQSNLTKSPIISCGDCITLLDEITDNLHSAVAAQFAKQHFNSKIGKLIGLFSTCETQLKP